MSDVEKIRKAGTRRDRKLAYPITPHPQPSEDDVVGVMTPLAEKYELRDLPISKQPEPIDWVRGLAINFKSAELTPVKLIHAVQAGLPVRALEVLQASLAVPMDKLGSILGISKATLHRRRSGQRLSSSESDRVVRFARLMGKAVEVMESEDNARKWLNSAQRGLDNAVPLEFAETEVGAREVEDLLGRIEYGVYS